MNDLFRDKGVQIDILEKENFLKIQETLTRIGTPVIFQGVETNTIEQSCHILHKRNVLTESCYAILHFKEMYELDGFESTLSDTDIGIRNKIVLMLEQWGLCKMVNPKYLEPVAVSEIFKVIPHKYKHHWNLEPKYKMAVRK